MKYDTLFIGASAIHTKSSLDVLPSCNLLSYGVSNRVFIYDPNIGATIGTESHAVDGVVTCVKWVHQLSSQETQYLLCCTSVGQVYIFSFKPDERSNVVLQLLNCVKVVKAHSASINSCDALMLKPSEENEFKIVFVTTAYDGFIKGWTFCPFSDRLDEILNYNLPGHALALELKLIPSFENEEIPILVYGGDDSKLHFVSFSTKGFEYVGNLRGHEDWVMTLDYYCEDVDVILASGSKDGMVRLWRLSLTEPKVDKDELHVKCIQLKLPNLEEVSSDESPAVLYCSLESVLHGHVGLVSHLSWRLKEVEKDVDNELLSCSKTDDRSVIIWGMEDGLWIEKARLGEVGGNREGYFTAVFVDDGKSVVATNYQGGLHKWTHKDDRWTPRPLMTGHFNEVVDLDWDINGKYLMTTSKDQTTRIFCLSKLENRWQEMARPQVHGYDMSCIARLKDSNFASGAEEKVIRGFFATGGFVSDYARITGNLEDQTIIANTPARASVPSLGLSNKGFDSDVGADASSDKMNKIHSKSESGDQLTEDHLILGTLWPEVSKLYGHGNELLALASSSDGQLLASSCRASNELDAHIIIWNCSNWKQVSTLPVHRLSVTQMEFTQRDEFLLSVSRDRTWNVSRLDSNGCITGKFSSSSFKKTQHSRIIWSCAWLPCSLRFATGSRDKTVAVWRPIFPELESDMPSWEREAVSKEEDEVTAVAASVLPSDTGFVIAIGLVSGKIILRSYNPEECVFSHLVDVEPSHRKAVRRLKFQPKEANRHLTLASCGTDNCVIIYDLNFES